MTSESKMRCNPFIKASFEIRGPLFIVFIIQNAGTTGAVDLKAEISTEPSDYKTTILFPLLMPNQIIRILLPETNLKVLAEKYAVIKVDGECKNIWEEIVPIHDKIQAKEVLKSWTENRILLEESVTNRLSQIADKLERLERSVDRMIPLGGGVLTKTPQDVKEEYERMEKEFEAHSKKQEPTKTS